MTNPIKKINFNIIKKIQIIKTKLKISCLILLSHLAENKLASLVLLLIINSILWLFIRNLYNNYFLLQDAISVEVAGVADPLQDIIKKPCEKTTHIKDVPQNDIEIKEPLPMNIIDKLIVHQIAIAIYEGLFVVINGIIDIINNLNVITEKSHYDNIKQTLAENPVNIPHNDLIDKNTIFSRAVEKEQLFNNDKVWIIMQNLITLIKENLYIMPSNDEYPRMEEIIHNIIKNDSLSLQLLTHNIEDLRNVNHIVNLLIQDAMIQWALTGDKLYFYTGFALMIEQIALLENKNVFYYYDDIDVYQNFLKHFIDRFKL